MCKGSTMWTTHAGLKVKRSRGMTLPQVNAGGPNRRDPSHELEPKRASKGRLSEIDVFWRARRDARRERKKRREAKRVRRIVKFALGTASRLGSFSGSLCITSPSRIMRPAPVDWPRFKDPLTYDRFTLDGRTFPPESRSSPLPLLESFELTLAPVVKRTD